MHDDKAIAAARAEKAKLGKGGGHGKARPTPNAFQAWGEQVEQANAFNTKGPKKGRKAKGGARERSATPDWNRKGAGPAWEDGKGKGGQGKGRPSSPWRAKGGGKGTKVGQQGRGKVPFPVLPEGSLQVRRPVPEIPQ